MYIFFENEEQFKEFNNKNFIKIDTLKLISGFTWNNLDDKFVDYRNSLTQSLQYELLVCALNTLQGSLVALNCNVINLVTAIYCSITYFLKTAKIDYSIVAGRLVLAQDNHQKLHQYFKSLDIDQLKFEFSQKAKVQVR